MHEETGIRGKTEIFETMFESEENHETHKIGCSDKLGGREEDEGS